MTVWLELRHVEQICFELANQLPWRGNKEPIPPFNTRFPGRLESCLAMPKQGFAGRLLYPTLIDQAAILFYLLNKNHPFQNGNKRIALTSLIVFLVLNEQWLEVSDLDSLYAFSVGVAGSLPKEKDAVLEVIKNYIRSSSIPFSEMQERFKK